MLINKENFMNDNSHVLNYEAASPEQAHHFFSAKLSYETDCSDVYADIKNGTGSFVFLDVRSKEAFNKSHAITALNFPHGEMSKNTLLKYSKETIFVVYCWGSGCNGATKAAIKLSALGYRVKEMIGGIDCWENFEKYPVNRRVDEEQS